MNLSFLQSGRTVLLVADEFLYVYACGSKGVRLVEKVSWDTEGFEESVAGVISRDCGGKPVVIVNDMVEQHYRKEKILRRGISFSDKKSMVRRKLNMAFSNYPVRAALALKEKAPKEGAKGGGDIYIFAAIPESAQFQKVLDAVALSLASVKGLCLLPVESSDMVKALYAKVMKKGQPKARWVVFMGQHRSGGLRQIVIKNGELALTRMTPVVDSEDDPQAWAGEVRQEFAATMSYLARFGYQPEDGLHVIAIAGVETGAALQSLIEETASATTLTAPEASQLLGAPYMDGEEGRYADPLHAWWIARKRKLLLPMKSVRLERVSQPRSVAMAASFVLLCGIAFLGYQTLSSVGEIASADSEIQSGTESLTNLKVQYEQEIERKKKLGFDIRLVQSSIAVYDSLDKEKIDVLSFYNNLGRALGKDMRFDKLTVKKASPIISVNLLPNGQPAKPPLFEAVMQMTYPSSADIDKGNKEVQALAVRLKEVLKDHDVKVTKLLKDYEYSEGIIMETGDLQKKNVNQDYVAEISIKGPPAP